MSVNVSNVNQAINVANKATSSTSTTSSAEKNYFHDMLQSSINSVGQTNNSSFDSEDVEQLLESGNLDNSQILMMLMNMFGSDYNVGDQDADIESLLMGLQGNSLDTDSVLNLLQGNSTDNVMLSEEAQLLLNSLSGENTNHVASQVQIGNAENNSWNLPSNLPDGVIDSINSMRQARDNIMNMANDLRNPNQVVANDALIENQANANLLNNGNVENIDLTVVQGEHQIVQTVEGAFEGESTKNDLNSQQFNEGIADPNQLKVNEITVKYQPITENVNTEDAELRNQIINQIKDQMLLVKSEGKDVFTMQLNPEELGKLDVKMILENGSLSVEILATNQKAYELILSSMGDLKNLLENSLINKDVMEVDSQKQYYDQEGGNQNFSGQQEKDDEQNENDSRVIQNILELEEEVDFFKELAQLRDYRFNAVNYI